MTNEMEKRMDRMEEKMNKILERIKPMGEINRNMQILNDKMESIKELEKKVEELQSSQQFFNGKFEDFTKSFQNGMKEILDVKSKIQKQEVENIKLKKEVKDLRVATMDLQSIMLQNQVDIVGIQSKAKEDLRRIVKEIGMKINEAIDDKDIADIKRVNNKKGNDQIIHVKFTTSEKRQNFLVKGKKARLSGKDIGGGESVNKIYINETLSYLTKELLYQARKSKVEKDWKYVLIKDKKVFIRKTEGSPAIRIFETYDLEKLMK